MLPKDAPIADGAQVSRQLLAMPFQIQLQYIAASAADYAER